MMDTTLLASGDKLLELIDDIGAATTTLLREFDQRDCAAAERLAFLRRLRLRALAEVREHVYEDTDDACDCETCVRFLRPLIAELAALTREGER